MKNSKKSTFRVKVSKKAEKFLDNEVQIVEPAGDVEVKILKEILRKIEAIRLGFAEPRELEKVAVDAIAKFSLANLSDEVSEILHDCIDFAEQPLLSDLKEIEERVREILKRRIC